MSARATTTAKVEFDRIRKEITAYDTLARQKSSEGVELAMAGLIGRELVGRFRSGQCLGAFPRPARVWIDSLANPVSQQQAYEWVSPLEGKTFVQLGGSGSHAIKALMAGAKSAILLTPMAGEGALAVSMADALGLGGRLQVVQAIGELIPLADGSVDAIFGGGTLHHVALEPGLAEVARVLKPGGRASFVDPALNFVYRLLEMTRLRNLAREKGAQCYPLRVSDVLRCTKGYAASETRLSGGPSRYAIVGMTRVLKLRPSLGLSMSVQKVETAILSRLGLRRMLGSLAVLLEAPSDGKRDGMNW
jgi:hypothetical protein